MTVRMRHTSSHTKNRRSHHALVGTNVVADKESGALRLPHRLDETTGMYRGKQIVEKIAMKKEQKKEKAKKKERGEHEHTHGADTNQMPQKHDKKNEDREKQSQGLLGRMITGKAKSRSGFGGGA
jgi:ribosomal protein L32